MHKKAHKLFIPFLLLLIHTPVGISKESYKDTLFKYAGGTLLVGITCGLLLKKLNHKDSPKGPTTENLFLPTIRNYLLSHYPAIHLIRSIVSNSKNGIKNIQLHVIHPYNAILDSLAIEKDLKKGLGFSSSAKVRVLQEVNEDIHANYDINALQNYITNKYPEYICVDIIKNYTGIELTLMHQGNEQIDCQFLEQELRTLLEMPASVKLTVFS